MDITERKITKIARKAETLVLRTLREEDVGTAEIEASFYEYLTGVLTPEEAVAFAAALDKLYTAFKKESRAGFPHFQKMTGGEADDAEE